MAAISVAVRGLLPNKFYSRTKLDPNRNRVSAHEQPQHSLAGGRPHPTITDLLTYRPLINWYKTANFLFIFVQNEGGIPPHTFSLHEVQPLFNELFQY